MESASQDLLNPIIAGVIAAIVAAIVTFFLTKSSQKQDQALRFHEYFFARPLLEARAEAHKLLLEHRGKPLLEIYESDDYKRLDPLWEIQEFFVRLNVAIKYKLVDKQLAAEMFAQNFLFWWKLVFEDGIARKEWAIEPELVELNDFFRSQLSTEAYNKHITRAVTEIDNPGNRHQ